MVWWFILGASFFVLGGILAVQPTKTQKRIARLRESAIQSGLHVKLPVSLKFPEGEVKSEFPYYCLNVKDRKLANVFVHMRREDVNSSESLEGSEAAFAQALEEMGEDYLAIYLGSGLLGISWNESGDEQVPEKLISVLRQLEDKLFLSV